MVRRIDNSMHVQGALMSCSCRQCFGPYDGRYWMPFAKGGLEFSLALLGPRVVRCLVLDMPFAKEGRSSP